MHVPAGQVLLGFEFIPVSDLLMTTVITPQLITWSVMVLLYRPATSPRPSLTGHVTW